MNMSLQGLEQSLKPESPFKNPDDPIAMSYEVTVSKASSPEFFLGKAVTHLSLDDWAAMHGYKVHGIGNVRPALAGERTDLK